MADTANATILVTALGTAPLTYTWYRNGVPFAGPVDADGTLHVFPYLYAVSYAGDVSGQFQVLVSHSGGSVMSSPSALAVHRTGPIVQEMNDPQALGEQSVYANILNATALSFLQFQFLIDGVAVPSVAGSYGGSPVLSLPVNYPGLYQFQITDATGTFTAYSQRIGMDSRLTNLSGRTWVGLGAAAGIGGFVIAGPPGIAKKILVRAVGPSLSALGVSAPLARPTLTVYDGTGAMLATNSGWTTVSDPGATAAAAASAGAFALAAGSADSALLLNLVSGAYSAVITSGDGTPGIALVETYEINASDDQPLLNLSERGWVGQGESVLIGGLTVGGIQPIHVLIRASGPALAAFGVAGVLAQPSLQIVNASGAVVATNAGWSTDANATLIGQAAAAAGAFPFPPGSADSAVLVSLPPGAYSAVVSGINGAVGVTLLECYQVPN